MIYSDGVSFEDSCPFGHDPICFTYSNLFFDKNMTLHYSYYLLLIYIYTLISILCGNVLPVELQRKMSCLSLFVSFSVSNPYSQLKLSCSNLAIAHQSYVNLRHQSSAN